MPVHKLVYTKSPQFVVRSDSGLPACVGRSEMLIQQDWTNYSGSGRFDIHNGSPRIAEKLMGKCIFEMISSIELCRLCAESASCLGFGPMAAPMRMTVPGGSLSLAMRPMAPIVIWMLVHVVGIGRGKV